VYTTDLGNFTSSNVAIFSKEPRPMPETPSLTQTHLKLSFANRETHLFEISPSPEIHRIESEMRYVTESQKVSDALVGKDKFAN
jgi:hypothetical protein